MKKRKERRAAFSLGHREKERLPEEPCSCSSSASERDDLSRCLYIYMWSLSIHSSFRGSIDKHRQEKVSISSLSLTEERISWEKRRRERRPFGRDKEREEREETKDRVTLMKESSIKERKISVNELHAMKILGGGGSSLSFTGLAVSTSSEKKDDKKDFCSFRSYFVWARKSWRIPQVSTGDPHRHSSRERNNRFSERKKERKKRKNEKCQDHR